jgi:hypothetical protein
MKNVCLHIRCPGRGSNQEPPEHKSPIDQSIRFSVYRVYSESIDNILMWIWEVYSTAKRRTFMIYYLCVLFVEDSVKRHPRRIV